MVAGVFFFLKGGGREFVGVEKTLQGFISGL
jgi:hypothetical protein